MLENAIPCGVCTVGGSVAVEWRVVQNCSVRVDLLAWSGYGLREPWIPDGRKQFFSVTILGVLTFIAYKRPSIDCQIIIDKGCCRTNTGAPVFR